MYCRRMFFNFTFLFFYIFRQYRPVNVSSPFPFFPSFCRNVRCLQVFLPGRKQERQHGRPQKPQREKNWQVLFWCDYFHSFKTQEKKLKRCSAVTLWNVICSSNVQNCRGGENFYRMFSSWAGMSASGLTSVSVSLIHLKMVLPWMVLVLLGRSSAHTPPDTWGCTRTFSTAKFLKHLRLQTPL